MSSFSLAGKKAVVTGGSSGLGVAAVKAARAGADIAVADIDGGEAGSIIAQINNLGRAGIPHGE